MESNLQHFYENTALDAYVTQPLSAYRYKKLAIDVSLYMFKHKPLGDRWISCFVSLLQLYVGMKYTVFVFDNEKF